MTAHTIELLVANKPGVLLRITLIFSRRGFNIESLAVSEALDGDYSRMSITAKGEENTLQQIIKSLNKLIDVIYAKELAESDRVSSELALIKVECMTNKRSELLQIIDHYKAQAVDIAKKFIIIQATGPSESIDNLIELLRPYKITELVRSGKLVISKH